MSRRLEPGHREYYQLAADVIAVFWAFHRERIQTGNVEFAYKFEPDYGVYLPLDLQRSIDIRLAEDSFVKIDPVVEFSLGAQVSMIHSFYQYSGRLGFKAKRSIFEDRKIPESAGRLIDPYVADLFKETEDLGRKVSKLRASPDYSVPYIFEAGAVTGTKIPANLAALMGESFNPRAALLMAKIDAGNLSNMAAGINVVEDDEMLGRFSGYWLLDDSKEGLNRGILKSFGLGDSDGCPAGIMPSERTKEFLAERGFVVQGTMIEDYATVVGEQYQKYVMGWFNELSEGERQAYLRSKSLDMLTGETRRTALERNVANGWGCPFGRERG